MQYALVVDESRAIRMVARRIFERIGFEVFEAENSEHGIALWGQWQPDLVLANWHGAGADWLFENIRKHPTRPTTKLVAFLVEIDPRDMESAIRVGVDAFLLKPFTRETLEAMLDEVGLLIDTLERPHHRRRSGLSGITTPDDATFAAEFSQTAEPTNASIA